jgi:hypothetical protein
LVEGRGTMTPRLSPRTPQPNRRIWTPPVKCEVSRSLRST